MSPRQKKTKPDKVDGLGPGDLAKIRTAIRQVWSWSHARRLCLKRATDAEGYGWCELCGTRAPKIFPDHIVPAGAVDAGFIKRMFCPSTGLQALCRGCHSAKTREERKRVPQV